MNSKPRVLVIEDQPLVAKMIATLLREAGCDVAEAFTGEDALELAGADDFNLITTDIDLPGMSGFELCEHFKRSDRTSHTPIIVVSGGHEADSRKAIELGAADYISKPFDFRSFASRVLAHVSLF